MNEKTAREKMVREQRIREDARAAGYAEGWGVGRARAEEVYSVRMSDLERRVRLLEAVIAGEETRAAPLERNPKRILPPAAPTHDPSDWTPSGGS